MRTMLTSAALVLAASGIGFTQESRPRSGLQLSSPAIAENAPIPEAHSDYGEKISPPLKWSGAPTGTQSFVLLMEDPDATEPKPFVHWVLYNLPASVTGLPEAINDMPRLNQFGGALQGRTSRGNIGYFGPRPPKGDPPHHYQFKLYALDTTLPLDPGAQREDVLKAMAGRILAEGELVGTFKAPSDAK